MAADSARRFKLQIWQVIIVPIIIAAIPIIYPDVIKIFQRKPPQFAIQNPIIARGDRVLVILPENQQARKREDLNIVVEGIEFADAGRLSADGDIRWEFSFTELNLPTALFSEGLNTLELGFPSSNTYDQVNVYVRANFYADSTINYSNIAQSKKPTINFTPSDTLEKAEVQIRTNNLTTDSINEIAANALYFDGGFTDVYLNRDSTMLKNTKAGTLTFFHEADEGLADSTQQLLAKKGIEVEVVDVSDKFKDVPKQKTSRKIDLILPAQPKQQ